MALPAWLAWIVQVPVVTRWTVEPLTVQTPVVVELKLTARPELAVALTLKSAAPSCLSARAPKVIVWLALVTLKLRETEGAAL